MKRKFLDMVPVRCMLYLYILSMENRKVYIVKLLEREDHYSTQLKVFSSLLKAKNYCECEASKLSYRNNSIEPEDHETWWEDNFTYIAKVNDFEWILEIDETDLDEDVVDVSRPEIEVENEILRKENLELREKLSKQAAMNAAAQACLIMWDGGWKYTKEHVLDCMYAAKDMLERNAEGDKALKKMFECWMKFRNADDVE